MWLKVTIRLVKTLVDVVKPIRGLRNRFMAHLPCRLWYLAVDSFRFDECG
jgi:hypothetical protein